MGTEDYTCETEFETSDVVLGFLLSVGIIISFLPQIIVMIFRKNVDGLSVIMCWLNYVNCMGTFVNVLFLNWFMFECTWLNSWTLFRNLLPVVQLAPPFICTLIIFILYVIYRPKLTTNIGDSLNSGEISKIVPEGTPVNYNNSCTLNNNNNDIESSGSGSGNNGNGIINNNNEDIENISVSLNTDGIIDFGGNSSNNGGSGGICGVGSSNDSTTSSSTVSSGRMSPSIVEQPLLKGVPRNRVEEFIVKMDWYSQPFFWGSIALSILLFVIGVGIVYREGSESKALHGYAFGCGIFALILVFFQWIPQIYTTIISNEIGSLSLVSVCIQAPGSFLVMYFQIESSQNWSTWVPYLATGLQQLVLIGICVFYLIRDRKKNKKEKEEKKKIANSSINNNNDIINNNNDNNNIKHIDNNNEDISIPENYQSEKLN